MAAMMRTSLVVCCCVFALQYLQVMLCLPARGSSRYKEAPVSENFQELKKRAKAPQTQELVKEPHSLTNSTLNHPRCGVPDYPTKEEWRHRGRYRQRRYTLYGQRWDKTDLTYRIDGFPWQFGEERVRGVFRDAAKIWSDVTPLTFTEVRNGHADIRIDFRSLWHGDNLPFDGRGGILAHAFFPKTHRQGEIHFDADESWTLGNHMGMDLLQVAAHEFGHVLGLQHTRTKGAIMSPHYFFADFPPRISNDDKWGIQHLYGSRRVRAPEPQTTTATTTTTTTTATTTTTSTTTTTTTTESNEIFPTGPDACRTEFDAVSMIRGELFFFKSGYVWRIRDGHLESGYPALASRHWRGIPNNIDAAFEDKSGNIWFFQGANYWVFDAERRIRGPESIRNLGLYESGIQAALRWGQDPNYNTYFFKSGSYWRFSPQDNRVESAPRSMQDWIGIPSVVDAAFRDIYGYAHFIRGRQYWKFDPVNMNSLEGYPRYVGVDFFGCRNGRF
ncbi:stromelysin-3-like [Simochromis diagramma]|uniref:stromelysin-3-like n=1 Tax=Simochromis diagramma TaxID=43689 RepID=UPI001A7E53D8|nr:stromelysin-3-like [Simochromis diagramma]